MNLMEINREWMPVEATPQEMEIWDILHQVNDPEIPVVSVVEMGMIRQVKLDDEKVEVWLTPTFSGCPALYAIQSDIILALRQAGYETIDIRISHNPPWTSDWITPAARQKLASFGLAPPKIHRGSFEILLQAIVICPHCGSDQTELKNSFGATLCRAIYYCKSCQQPFEQFKPL
jgi:ring-1,2-phenylacetyl-CoA epoxidase subunit PaaD